MDRFIFARPRPSLWRRGLRPVAAVAGLIALIGVAAGAGLLVSKRLNQITATQAVAPPSASSLLRGAQATDATERRFLVAEIAKDACKQAVLARVKYPTQASRAGFYQAAVFFVRLGGRNMLRVTGEAKLAGDVRASHAFSCDVQDGRVVKLALAPGRPDTRGSGRG